MSALIEEKLIQKGKKSDQVYNTETMLPISEIQEDTIILKDGGLRAIIKVEGLNLDLRNSEDTIMVLEQYKRFINSLDFPIQILVRNTYLDLTQYIDYMQRSVSHISAPLLREQGEQYISFLDKISVQQGLIFVKEFYIIIPYYANSNQNDMIKKPRRQKLLMVLDAQEGIDKIIGRYRTFLKHRRQLDIRANLVMEGLKGAGMRTERLQVKNIVSLLFSSYNPAIHVSQADFIG